MYPTPLIHLTLCTADPEAVCSLLSTEHFVPPTLRHLHIDLKYAHDIEEWANWQRLAVSLGPVGAGAAQAMRPHANTVYRTRMGCTRGSLCQAASCWLPMDLECNGLID